MTFTGVRSLSKQKPILLSYTSEYKLWYPLSCQERHLHTFPFFWISFPVLSLSLCPPRFNLMVCYKCLRPFSFFSFLFFSSDQIISNDLSLSLLILSSAWPSLVLNSISEFFSPVIVFFSSMISVWYFFISFFLISLYLCIVLMILVSLCVTVNMNPLLGKFYISVFLEPISEDLSYWIICKIFPCFFVFLTLYWYLCIRQKNHLS